MGRRGPSPEPTATLKLKGSWLAGRRKEEPVAPRTPPKRPAWLNADARRLWPHIMRALSAMQLLSWCDKNAIARYCDLLACYIVAAKAGDVDARLKLEPAIRRLEQEFGLTPSARARLSVEFTRDEMADALTKFVARKNA